MSLAHLFLLLWLGKRCKYIQVLLLCMCRASGDSFYQIADRCKERSRIKRRQCRGGEMV